MHPCLQKQPAGHPENQPQHGQVHHAGHQHRVVRHAGVDLGHRVHVFIRSQRRVVQLFAHGHAVAHQAVLREDGLDLGLVAGLGLPADHPGVDGLLQLRPLLFRHARVGEHGGQHGLQLAAVAVAVVRNLDVLEGHPSLAVQTGVGDVEIGFGTEQADADQKNEAGMQQFFRHGEQMKGTHR